MTIGPILDDYSLSFLEPHQLAAAVQPDVPQRSRKGPLVLSGQLRARCECKVASGTRAATQHSHPSPYSYNPRPCPSRSARRLFIIDGSNNVYRSYYAIRNLTNSAGFSTNAVYGFVTTLRKLLKDHNPDCIAVAFDEGRETARTNQFADYKKDRKPMPDDLVVQVPLVYEVLDGFRIPVIRSTEWEADDFIGSLACTARDRGYDVVIATSDKDFFQLVGDGIRLYHTGREVLYDAKGVEEVFGLPPEKVVDVMAIWGDAIDNIPGVPGIGEKGAKGLIQQFGSLDGVYENLEQIKKAAQRKALEDNKRQGVSLAASWRASSAISISTSTSRR